MSSENFVQPKAKRKSYLSRDFRKPYTIQLPIGTDSRGNPVVKTFQSDKSQTEARNLAIQYLVTLAERNPIGQWDPFESKGVDENDKL